MAAKQMQPIHQSWMGTSGLTSGVQLLCGTSSSFIAAVPYDTSAIPPVVEVINIKISKELPDNAVSLEQLFRQVTKQYQQGDLTLGEAAELLGMNRFEFDARLKELGIVQEPTERKKDEITVAENVLREVRGK
jgi:predicted HTH domain antitoxin